MKHLWHDKQTEPPLDKTAKQLLEELCRMKANKNVAVISVLAVFTCSLYANWPIAPPEEKRNELSRAVARRTMAEFGEFLLLPFINESDYNSKEATLPDFDDLIGIGEYARITVPWIGVHESSMTGQAWFRLFVCGPDLSVFRVSVSKPKYLSVACDLIVLRINEGFFSDTAVIPEVCTPRLEGEEYSLAINTEAYNGLTRLSVERGVLIGVDFRSSLQPVWTPANGEAILGQMNALIDDLIAWVDGDIEMTDEKEEYYKKLKAAYRAVVPNAKEAVARDPDLNIWGED